MKKCPTCNKPVNWQDNPFRPFCSERCKLLDFGHWADEDYRVPAHDERPALEETGESSRNDEVGTMNDERKTSES
ncbi:MAG TPA: DNA gyrase inhibitor YacG [Pyrinomonadaceae bacterium]|nr:DNA gyrase inhibitor YacG [Pyrinomonadaceae bacterium]